MLAFIFATINEVNVYAKLFASMYDGSLANKGPWEALVTFQQLVILADRFGVIDMTPEVISRRTLIPLDIIQRGIDALSAPDPESRRSEAEGRRIVPIDVNRAWGWQIVNYAHYHGIRSAEERREYMRGYMRKQRDTEKKEAAYSEEFSRFWNAYPRKVGKGAAWRAWKKAKPNADLQSKIFTALAEQIVSTQWTRDAGQYIPHPATWLNQSRWDDEATTMAQTYRTEHLPEGSEDAQV